MTTPAGSRSETRGLTRGAPGGGGTAGGSHWRRMSRFVTGGGIVSTVLVAAACDGSAADTHPDLVALTT